MANKQRGVIRLIVKAFIASVKPAPRPKLMGTDYQGTKYYEQEKRLDGSHKRNHRYFTPSVKENHEQDIPAEWESWLRHRRKDPPTEEEVNKNYQIMMSTKENASKLNQMYLEAKYGKDFADIKDIQEEQTLGTFPVYEEYKNEGQNYEVKNIKKRK